MSDFLTHECGIALLRLKKPLQYYINKYGTAFYALNKMYLLMEKQHNRGQDGAGIANIKLDVSPGKRYISRMRSIDNKPIQDAFGKIMSRFEDLNADQLSDADFLQQNYAFTGELSLGHLRYGTYGKNDIENCHPFLRQNNWRTRNLVVAGNFNMTNVDELFDVLIEIGQHPKQKSDTVTVLEKMGHYLDVENQTRFDALKSEGLDEVDEINDVSYSDFITNVDAAWSDEQVYKLPWVIDMRFGVNVGDYSKLSLVVSNLFNKEYTIRPLAIEPPRLINLVYTYELK